VVSIDRQRIAVFGNAGAGKSTLSRQLADITGLPLYVLDLIQFPDGKYRSGEKNGGKLSPEDYLKVHAELIEKEQWIIDGYGSVSSAWERFERANTLVCVDLPLRSHYWGVTKRLLKGLIKNPEDGPRIIRSWRARWTVTRLSASATGFRRRRIAHSWNSQRH
jgi:adenylate kinase family enzyme